MTSTFSPTDEHLFHVQAVIERHGFHITAVLGDRDAPGYCYTTGFLLHDRPEVAIIGLAPESAAAFLHHVYDGIRSGIAWSIGRGEPHRYGPVPFHLLPVPDEHVTEPGCLLAGIPCYFASLWGTIPADPAVQLVWPDLDHRFPWDDQVDWAVWRDQPILAHGDAPARHEPLPYDLDRSDQCDECRRRRC